MDIHKLIRKKVYEVTGVILKNYCYPSDSEKDKYIMFDVSKEDYNNGLIGKYKFISDEFEFKRARTCKELDEDTVEIRIFYKPIENKDFSSNLFTGHKMYGAIAPDGKFYACGYAGHNNLEYWLEDHGLFGDKGGGRDSFEWFGWVKLTGAMMSECEFVFDNEVTEYDFKKREDIILKKNILTDAQIDAMVKYIDNLGRDKINFNFNWYELKTFDREIRKCKEDVIDLRMSKHEIRLTNGEEELRRTKE